VFLSSTPKAIPFLNGETVSAPNPFTQITHIDAEHRMSKIPIRTTFEALWGSIVTHPKTTSIVIAAMLSEPKLRWGDWGPKGCTDLKGYLLSKGGSTPIAKGTHDRETFVRVFMALFRNRRTGILDVHFGKKSRKLFFLGGEPVAFRSDLPEDDLGRTLVNAGLIAEKQVNWIRQKLTQGEVLEQAIVMSGALTTSQISEHKQKRLHANIGSPLLWGSGDWTFDPRPQVRVDQIDPSLRSETGTLAALWAAVGQHVSMDEVFPAVTDPKAGMLGPDPLCGALFPSLEVADTFSGVVDAIGQGSTVEDIFRQVPDNTGNLVKLLWFLEAAGLVHREGRPQDGSLHELIQSAFDNWKPAAAPKATKKEAVQKAAQQVTAAASNEPPKSAFPEESRADAGGEKKRRPPLTDDQIRAVHRKRIGRDFYSFLGLPPTAPNPAIDRKCKGLARRWRLPGKQRALSPEINQKVDELLAGVQLVWRTLTNETHRAEYDQRMQQGRAPKVGDLQGGKPPQLQPSGGGPDEATNNDALSPAHQRARDHMEQDQYAEALKLLKQARVDDPSSPDIMADIGWSTWKIQGAKNGDAEEFLRLALTFDNNHPRGLEFLAKVLVEQGNVDTAATLIVRLNKVDPGSKWAKKALQNLKKGT
jgi:tetratricopeptide (TPR) repeat protein